MFYMDWFVFVFCKHALILSLIDWLIDWLIAIQSKDSTISALFMKIESFLNICVTDDQRISV
jgi:hypothetical protein